MKKKLIILGALAALATGMSATDYNSLVFTLTDGTTQSITATGLNITCAEGTLTVTDGTNSLSLPLASLTKMEFSEAEATGISDIRLDDLRPADGITIYDLNGRQMQRGRKLPQGTYIMKTNGTTIKVQVRQ